MKAKNFSKQINIASAALDRVRCQRPTFDGGSLEHPAAEIDEYGRLHLFSDRLYSDQAILFAQWILSTFK